MTTSINEQSQIGIYLESQDVNALIDWARVHTTQRCNHEYPHFHRIADLISGDRAVRISRCAACGDKMFVKAISPEIADPIMLGVPFELNGSNLQRWIVDEVADPSKGSVNWNAYLTTESNQPWPLDRPGHRPAP